MDILEYLITLLKSHKQVGIQGLGTFIKQKSPGRYDAVTHTFLPPSYVLQFTTDQLEDFILTDYIQEERGISKESANYFVSNFTEQFLNDLKNGEQVIENLGVFSLKNDEVVFNAADNFKPGFDFFALPAISAINPEKDQIQPVTQVEPIIEQVEAPDFEQEVAKVNHAPVVDEEPVIKHHLENEATEEETHEEIGEVDPKNPTNESPMAIVETAEQELSANEILEEKAKANEYEGTHDEVEENQKSTSGFWKLMIVILILAAIIAAVYFLKPELFNSAQNTAQQDTTLNVKRDGLKTQSDSLAFADSVMAEAQKAGLEVEPAKDTLKVTTVAKPLPPISYHIIGAGFTRLSEAEEYIQIMKKKGYDAKIVVFPRNIKYKNVSIASFDNPDSAQKYVEIYRKLLKNESIYPKSLKNN